jgi:hypothetical protein
MLMKEGLNPRKQDRLKLAEQLLTVKSISLSESCYTIILYSQNVYHHVALFSDLFQNF